MIIAPTPIDALPPAPDPTQPQEAFDAAAYAWSDALPDFVTQANALAANVKNNADEAASKASTATSQAGIATTKASEADASATLASQWATKTGAAVAGGEYSAKHHAQDASSSAASAGGYRDAAQGFRNEAETFRNQADGHRAAASSSESNAAASETRAGEWAEKSTEVEPGKFSARYWAIQAATAVSDGVIDDAITSSIKTWSSQKISEQGIPVLPYDNRATLRSTPAIHGKQAVVDGLGLFAHHVGSDEPDDDETCFATATGRWLLQQPHPDLLSAWALPDDEVMADAASITRRILLSTATCALTTIAAVSAASFTAAVAGARDGAAAFAAPLGALDARLAVSARITAADTVTVTINNPSAAASPAGGIPATWQIFVFTPE